jgi:ribonuclease VapC
VTTEVVFDASAVLAIVRREPGGERLYPFRDRALLSAVNATEVMAKLLEAGLATDQIADGLRAVARQVVPFDEAQSRVAAEYHARTRRQGLSLADCACLALGRSNGLPVYTADRAWADLDLGVRVELIR